MPKSSVGLAFIEPALAELADQPPEGDAWLHEIKQDGFRTQLILENGEARAYSRNGLDWTERYAPIVAAAAKLKATSAIIDGEMIVPDEAGRSDFRALASAIYRQPQRLEFVAFDLLHLNGEDLRPLPLSERRRRLEVLLKPAKGRKLIFSHAYEGNGPDVFAAVEQLGLEGIVSKKATGRYRSGRRSGWLKIKSFELGIFDIVGVDRTPKGAPTALLARDGRYMGQGFIAVDNLTRDAFWRFVDAEKIDKPAITGLRKKGATWIRPGLTARVKHLRGEPDALRHASVLEINLPRKRKSLPRGQAREASRKPKGSAV